MCKSRENYIMNLHVPFSATVKDTRSPSPAHLVSLFHLKAPKGHYSWPHPLPLPSAIVLKQMGSNSVSSNV